MSTCPRLFLTLSFAWLAVAASPTDAADDKGQFAVKGTGLAKCSQLLKAFENQDRTLSEFGGYITGYTTAMNRMQPDTFDLAPWQSTEFLALALANYCAGNPETQFYQAIALMMQSLEKDRLKERSDPVVLKEGDQETAVYREVLRRVQSRLKELGHYSGGVDGLYGPQTKAAVQKLQKDKGVPETGFLDQNTLKLMFYPG